MAPAHVLCVGAAHWDLIARSDGELRTGDDVPGQIRQRPGGVALNVALGLAAREVRVSLCSAVGADDAGASLTAYATAAGVDCTDVAIIGGAATNRYLAIEDVSGDLFAAVAEIGLLEGHADQVAAKASRALVASDTLFLEANLPSAAIEGIARHAAARGVKIVVNPVSPVKAPRLVRLISEPFRATIVANLREANVLLGKSASTAAGAATALLAVGAEAALVTDGPRPAALATAASLVTSAPETLQGDVSVTGAGDALLAAFLASPDLHDEPYDALTSALRAAAEHMERHA
ncbi:MAG: PfkB family carbohydrate kinase [Pseudomonadota bacterium]